MVLESAQILSTLHHISPGEQSHLILKDIYKPTHAKHPSVLWTLQNQAHYDWLIRHSFALSREFSYRYDKKVDHASVRCLKLLSRCRPKLLEDSNTLRPFALAMPDDCKISDSSQNAIDAAVQSYRSYYIKYKRHIAQWTKRPIPDWFH